MAAKRIEELYREQVQLIQKAQSMLEKQGELTDKDNEQINAFLQQADDCEKRAKKLEDLLEKQTSMAAEDNKGRREQEQTERNQRSEKAGFKQFYEYMLAVGNAYAGKGQDKRLNELETKALSGNVGISGGFLLPTAHEAEILQARGEANFIRQRARIVPMSTRTVDFPRLKQTAGSAGVSGFYGGVVVYMVDDNDTITESQPVFGSVKLEVRDMAGYALVPNSLLRDSPTSLEAYLSGPGSFGGALGWQEDYFFLRGNGSGKPQGMLGATACVSVTRNAATNFKFVDAVTMMSKLLMTGGGSPIWAINQSVMPKLFQFQGGNNENLWLINAAQNGPSTLLGYPIQWTEKLPALGTEGDVMLVDPSMYLVGDRQAMTMDVSREEKFQKNQTAFRVLESIDGQPWLESYITLADGATQVSPFVKLT